MNAFVDVEPENLNGLDDNSLRLLERRWIEAACPPNLRNPIRRLHGNENRAWYFKLAKKGGLCPGWQRGHGGLGLGGDHPFFVVTYARHRCRVADLKVLDSRYVAGLKRGRPLDAGVSRLKIMLNELFRRITETMLEIAGKSAGLMRWMGGHRNLNPAGHYIQARPASSYGGPNQIQRNIIPKNVLALP